MRQRTGRNEPVLAQKKGMRDYFNYGQTQHTQRTLGFLENQKEMVVGSDSRRIRSSRSTHCVN